MIKIQNPFFLSDKLSDNSKKCLLYTALISLGISIVIFVPFMIWDKGYFLFFGDFNVQQIPFYKLAHKAVRSGAFLWNWNTDLGANFLGSYNFYMLFSPFFWLTLPFPNDFVPYLMGPLLILKHTCAAIFAYLFIKRFVKDFRFAILGSLLYAFSGFIVFNIFFNQFHESIVFFPLLLIGFEELLTKDRKFVFALAITLNCIINYWMFIGECIFLIVYFLCRITDPKIKISISKFLLMIFESALGVILAAFVLLPSILAICDNTRVGAGHLLGGWNLLLYNQSQRLPAIIQCFFFPPEIPSRPNFFPDNGAKWSSMAGWLPFVSMCGVLSFVLSRKKSWIKTLLITCSVMALVPFLNSLFVLANNGYYCRWFYMPILMMCVASAMAFENTRINLQRGTLWTAILSALFILPGILNLVPFPQRFWIYVGITGLSLLIFFYIIHRHRKSTLLSSLLLISVTITSMVYPSIFILYGKQHSDNSDFIINQAINGKRNLNMPNDQFYRIDVYKDIDNMGIFWELPCIQAFHSIVPSSIQRFYPEMGVKRDVASRPSWDKYELRSLLSTKYLFVRKEKASPDLEQSFPGLSKYDHQNGYDIYENQNFIPMGFCYDFCINKNTLRTLDEEDRRKMLIKAICLDEQDFFEYSNILPEYSGDLSSKNFSYEQFQEDVQSRKSITVKDFQIDKNGFSANIDLPNENLVFFSVPYDKGWSATVNNLPAKIVNANIGFMAIKCPTGHSQIRFDYFTPGFIDGLRISGVGIVLFLLYLSTVIIYNRKLKTQDPDLDI